MASKYRLYNEKESKKDKEYHKFWGKHIMTTHLSWRHYLRSKMAESYNFFNGTQKDTVYKSLFDVHNIKTEKGELSMPIKFVNFNKIRNRVKVKLGELASMGFEAQAQAINDSARTERTRFKMRTLQEMKLRPYMEKLAALSGIEFGINNELPKDFNEFESFMKHTYKQNTEVVIEACLNYNINLYMYKDMRIDLLLDAIVTGECHAKSVVKNGYPVLEKCNPLMTGYANNPNNNDFLHLSNIYFEFYYLSINQVLATYPNIKKKDILELQNNSNGEYYQGLDFGEQKIFEPFNDDKVFVFEARWIDTKKVLKKEESVDGDVDISVYYGEDAEKKHEIKEGSETSFDRKRIGWTRKVTLIGGELVADWGDCKYMIRNPEKPAEATHEYCSLKPYNTQGENVSDVDVMKPLQGLINWIITKMQLEITKSGGSAIAIDSSKIPKEWGDPSTAMNQLLYHLKANGLILYNGAQGEQIPNGSIPVSRFDTGLGASIAGLMQVFQLFDQQLEDISGTSRSQMGAMVSANQLSSVTQMNLAQSLKIDKPLYDKFLQFESNLLSKHAHQIRMTWVKHPERYKHIIGDLYYMFLEQDVDMVKSYHQVFVKTEPIPKQRLQEYLVAALNHGMPPHEALQIELKAQDSTTEAIREYINKMDKLQQQSIEMQQAAAQQQAEQAAAQQQGQLQGDIAKIKVQGEEDRKLSAMKIEPDLQKTAMKEATSKQKNEIELLKLMQSAQQEKESYGV